MVRSVYSHEALASDTEEPLRATAPFRSRLAKAGFNVSLSLQPVERCIDRANGDFASGACLEVEVYNAPARALYDSVGLNRQVYRYHYRRQPPSIRL